MTRALVVVESMFANTRSIGAAIADGLAATMDVEVVDVATAPPTVAADIELLVAGGPTHAFGMTRQATRRSAVEQGAFPAVATAAGIREWTSGLGAAVTPVAAAAFDTRIRKRGVPGSAARGVARRLGRRGFRSIAAPQSFYVLGTPGPLLAGELERARRWGARLALDWQRTRPHVYPDGADS